MSIERAVEGLYRVLLNRSAEPAGRAHWVAQFGAQADAADFAAFQRAAAIEAPNRVVTVAELYNSFLGRAPSAADTAFWQNELGASIDAADIFRFFSAALPEINANPNALQPAPAPVVLPSISYIFGGAGNDSLTGSAGRDGIAGGAGADTINAAAGVDVVVADANGTGTIDADRINLGGDAGDELAFSNVGNGRELLVGFVSGDVGNGAGTVRIVNQALSAANANNGANLANVTHTQVNNTNVTLTGTNLHVVGTDAAGVAATGQDRGVFAAVHLLSAAADTFATGNAGEYVNAGAGDDTVTGGSGADFLVGGAGNDRLVGNSGNDTFIGGGGADVISGGSGVDRAILDVSATTIDADSVNLGGDAGDTLATINLAAGRELLVGFVSGDVGNGAGTVRIVNQATSAANANNGVNLASATHAQLNNTNVSMTGGTWHVVGTDAAGVAATGQDRGVFGAVHLLSAGADTFTLGTANEYVNAGAGDDTLTGNTGNDFLVGGAGNDVLAGAAGNDTFIGGAGADVITGGDGADVFGGNFGGAGQSVAATVASLASGASTGLDAGETLTFGGGVERVTDFSSAQGDKLDVATAATAPTSLLGVAGALASGTSYVVYGSFNAGSGVFTAAAAFNASTARDALLVTGDGTLTAATQTGYVVLTGLAQALVAGDLI